jgi:acetyl esterase
MAGMMPEVGDDVGMALDPAIAAHLDALRAAGARPYHQMASADEARAAFREVAALRRGEGPPPGPRCAVEGVRRTTADGAQLWCRIYRPLDRSAFDEPMPVVLFAHGGGWVIGDLDTHDPHARAFVALPATVVSVEYRLAPEHPYPRAHEDCWDWLRWVADGVGDWVRADRLVLAGDSAGGLLAAALAQRCRDEAGAPAVAAQCLVYPALDPGLSQPSAVEHAEGGGLAAADMRWFYEQYLPGGEDPGAAFGPWARDDLAGLPPAVITTAGSDPLRDDGLVLGDRLRQAGVPVAQVHLPGLVHGFFGMGGISPAAQAGVEATVAALRALLDAAPPA